MPNIVDARSGDCLCGIAVDHGFLNCEPLRALAENAALLARPLREGDRVIVPDLAVEEFARPVDSLHSFTLLSSPPFNIRFVHGSADLPYRDDMEMPVLHVSNFVTNLGGADGMKAFPTGYGFHDHGHQDPDSFKVEVWDPGAGGSVNVKLEALKPVYTADGAGKLTVSGWVEFGDAQRRIDALACNQVGPSAANTYRSKYMRLVVDEEDRDNAGISDQVLFVSDMADGLGSGGAGDNDSVEILDQMVRATYEIQRCTGSPKCKVTKTVEIGGEERRRVRLHFYALRAAVGGNTMPTGVSDVDIQRHLRRRTFKWYRRVYAQADAAPRLVTMNVVDPPPENMMCLSHSHGRAVATAVIVQLRFRVTTATQDLPVQIVFAGGETPVVAGGVIAAGLPAGFSAEVHACPRATNAANPAADVIITADNGERVTLLDIQLTAGARLTIDVPRVNLMSVIADDAAMDASPAFLTVDFKRLLRMTPVSPDAMHCVVVGRFNTPGLRGIAFTDCHLANAAFRPDIPFHSSTIMAYQASDGAGGFMGVLDNEDTLPFTSPHESTHTLCDLVHTKPGTKHHRTQLLGAGTSRANSVTATKRLCDGPYMVTMNQNLTTTAVDVFVKLVEKLRTHGAAKLEAW